MASNGVESNQELKDRAIFIDGRSVEQRLGDFLLNHHVMRNVLIGIVCAGLVLPSIIPALLLVGVTLSAWWNMTISRVRMPIRYPAWTKHPDPSSIDDNMGLLPASGIEFIGVERRGATIDRTREIWCSESDARTHRIYMGTTGAGKTQALLSMLFNPLCWGSGFSFTDGKAQIDVTANVFVMAWMFWREDDVVILNYMRGGQDRFKEMVNKPKVGVRKTRVSNTWNPFSTANHETISQIIDSIMEKATGDGAQWQAKAINMKNAVVQTIAYLRAKGDMLMSVSAIREMMSLDNVVKLAMSTDIPPAAAAAIRSYLSSGLPGFSWQLAKKGKPQSSDTLLQHGYLTGQFTRTLGLMTDTYFDIFGDEIPEFDTQDTILNNRISFTMIPTLEKGVEEAGNLGKMQVASAKMMMSENLGFEIEGDYETVVENRQTNTDRPFYLVMDELGYYFAPGIDLMFAQGRSLQIALVAAGQDFQAMAKNNKNEVESMIANTRIKISLKLEDPKETFEIFQKAAGEAYVARLSGFEMGEASTMTAAGQYNKTHNATIEKVSRISLQELKKLGAGDGVMLYADKVIRFRSFNLFMHYKFDKKKVNIRINTFLPIALPELSKLSEASKPYAGKEASPSTVIYNILNSGTVNWKDRSIIKVESGLVFQALKDASRLLKEMPNTNPADRGAFLFVKALDAMKNGIVADAAADIVNNESPVSADTAAQHPPSPSDTGGTARLPIQPPAIVVDAKNAGVDVQDVAEPDWDTGATSADTAVQGEWRTDFNENVKSELKRAISTLSGMPADGDARAPADNTMVEEEYEKIRRAAQESSRFKEAGEGAEIPPAAISSPEDVLAKFDDFNAMLR